MRESPRKKRDRSSNRSLPAPLALACNQRVCWPLGVSPRKKRDRSGNRSLSMSYNTNAALLLLMDPLTYVFRKDIHTTRNMRDRSTTHILQIGGSTIFFNLTTVVAVEYVKFR